MKNYLKIAFGITFVSVLSVGCKKNSTEPAITEVPEFTITSETFAKGKVNHDLIINKKISHPHITWQNAPAGTKSFLIIMEDDHGSVYCTKSVNITEKSLKEDLTSNEDFGMIPDPDKQGRIATVEAFALHCTREQFIGVVSKVTAQGGISSGPVTRAKFEETLKKNRAHSLILGKAKLIYEIEHYTSPPAPEENTAEGSASIQVTPTPTNTNASATTVSNTSATN